MIQRGRGFILVLVLWVLLALTIAASALAAWVSRTTDQAVLLADERRGQVDAADTMETLKFLFATRPTRVGGLYLGPAPLDLVRSWRQNPFSFPRGDTQGADLPLDGRVWKGLGSTSFSLQDENGLLNAQGFGKEQLEAWLGSVGISPLRTQGMVERLLDYTGDRRQITSFSSEYRSAGLEPPPFRFLLTPLEALKIMSWRERKALLHENGWGGYAAVFAAGSMNLNTAPRELLMQHPSMAVATARRVVGLRTQRPFRTAMEAARRVDGWVDEFSFITLPSDVLRLTVQPSDDARMLRYTLRLTARADAAQPWRVEYFHPVQGATLGPSGLTGSVAASAEAVEHPLFTPSQ